MDQGREGPSPTVAASSSTGSLAAALQVDRAEWDALALRSGNVFCSHEWLDTWWRRQQPGASLSSVQVRDGDGSLAGLLPLVVARRRPTLLQPLGQWPGPEMCLVADPDRLATVGPQLGAALAARRDWDLLRLGAVPVRMPLDGLASPLSSAPEPNFTLHLGGQTWEEFSAGRSKNFRERNRRRERVLRREFTLSYRRSVDPDRLDADIDELLRLHRLRWGDRSVGLTPESDGFHRDFLRQALARDWLSLWFLELDGRAVAANLNFRFAGREISYQGGRDPDFERHNVGLALVVHTVREAADAGLQEYRFLRGGQEYKRRLADRDDPVEHRSYARGLVGTGVQAGRALRRWARTRVSGAQERWRSSEPRPEDGEPGGAPPVS